jgi:hypothetical protein
MVNIDQSMYYYVDLREGKEDVASHNVRDIRDALSDPLWELPDDLLVGTRVAGSADGMAVKGILLAKVPMPSHSSYCVVYDESMERFVECTNIAPLPKKRRMTWEEMETALGYEIELI